MLGKIRTGLNQLLPRQLRPAVRVEKFLSQRLQPEPVILNGPFKGMRYLSESVGSILAPKILGAYEVELAAIVQNCISDAPGVLLDVGAAEGYYAVGMAWRCRNVKVIAYEAEENGRRLLAQLAAMNGVSDRIEINGFCGHDVFLTVLQTQKPRLVIMDIEGGESALLSEDAARHLGQTDLLVELHPWAAPDIEATLIKRFQATHTIQAIETRPRCSDDLPFGFWRNRLMARWLVPKLDEGRPEAMRWLHLTANSRST